MSRKNISILKFITLFFLIILVVYVMGYTTWKNINLRFSNEKLRESIIKSTQDIISLKRELKEATLKVEKNEMRFKEEMTKNIDAVNEKFKKENRDKWLGEVEKYISNHPELSYELKKSLSEGKWIPEMNGEQIKLLFGEPDRIIKKGALMYSWQAGVAKKSQVITWLYNELPLISGGKDKIIWKEEYKKVVEQKLKNANYGKYDSNNDGTADTTAYQEPRSNYTFYVEQDKNGDGKADFWEYIDSGKQIIYEEDNNFDGKVDIVKEGPVYFYVLEVMEVPLPEPSIK